MSKLAEVRLEPLGLERFEPLIGRRELRAALEVAGKLRDRMQGRVLWNINSTAVGGGVAEMLQSLLRYCRGVGIDTRWIVIEGNPAFYAVTKRLHHALHGSRGDGSSLGKAAREAYEEALRANAVELNGRVRPGDAVILHDPQTAGLAPHLARAGARLIWRCHVGDDRWNDEVDRGWDFLAPYLAEMEAYVFSREAYVPDDYNLGRSRIIRPSIDAFSCKNCELDERTVHTVLVHTGVVEGPPPDPPQHGFVREDGSPGRVERRADVVRLGRAPAWQTPLVVQISRWDTLKDFVGVLEGFARLCERGAARDAQLVLAGPNVKGVTDDPEGGAAFDAVLSAWRALPHGVRARAHLVTLPTQDVDENAIVVNALQRHAAIVVQKSLREGFGLTVTEAMWKGRPVVASAVGGIQDQIESGVSGVLLEDPTDLDAFADAVGELLADPELAERLGTAARERVREEFLGVRHLLEFARLFEEIDV